MNSVNSKITGEIFKTRRILVGIFITFLCLAAAVWEAAAATYTVDLTTDASGGSLPCTPLPADCDLRSALSQANSTTTGVADTIDFDPVVFGTPRTITLFQWLDMSDNATTTIQGPGANLLSISGGGASNVFLISGSAVISDVTIRDGAAAFFCTGGIENTGSLTVTRSVITNNNSFCFAGGISHFGTALNINDSTISNNTGIDAGGIWVLSPATIKSSTITGNRSGNGQGNGIRLDGGSLDVTSSTIAGNYDPFNPAAGAGVWNSGAPFFSGNSIYADNTDFGLPDIDGSGLSNSNGFNLVENLSKSFLPGPGDIFGVDPNLGPLGDYGGPTPTMSLGAGSPAIDMGMSFGMAKDQRGFNRPVDDPNTSPAAPPPGDYADMGAFEVLAPTAAGATVEGRVMTRKRRGIRGAIVSITLPNGTRLVTRTNPFGYFRFYDIEVGNTYVVSVSSKRYNFTPQVINVDGAVNDLHIYAQ